jgi:fucose permease
MSLMWAINASRIASRFGRTRPAIIGALCLAGGGAYWLTLAPADPSYWRGFLPGLLIAGCGAGLVQAPLFATASTLSAHRATTGSAVLNTARQVGSAVGVALLVVLLGAGPTTDVADYRRGWWLLVVAGLSAALAVALVRTPITTRIAPAVAGAHRRERTKQ